MGLPRCSECVRVLLCGCQSALSVFCVFKTPCKPTLICISALFFFISQAVIRCFISSSSSYIRCVILIYVDGLCLCNDTEIGFDNRASGARETKWTITGKPNRVLYFITFIKHSVSPVLRTDRHNPPHCYARLA